MTLTINEQKQDGYERIVSFSDDGFHCIIAVHNTVLGPAIGGCRLKSYASQDDALLDVMRLAKGMTYKSSLAGLWFGGGKCVVMADKATRDIMLKVGEAVQFFDGQYITAEDVGTTLDDIEIAAEMTAHTVHLDGSSMTARGVLACMRAAVKWQGHWGDDLRGVPIWVQGLGKVGMDLTRRLVDLEPQHMNLSVNDLRPELVATAVAMGAREIIEADKKFIAVYAPCAMGQVITADNVDTINYSVICGSANNQLLDDAYADVLHKRDVLFVPDFLANAGGVVNAAYEIGRPFDQVQCEEHTDALADVMIHVLELAKAERLAPWLVANTLAEARL
jgi:leucine dehydrogenase